MSNLKDSLHAALEGWRSDDTNDDTNDGVVAATPVAPTTMTHNRPLTVSESTFNYVRSNPYVTKQEAIAALTALGYNPASTTSLLAHMVRQGLLSQDHVGKLTAIVKHYIPLRATRKESSPVTRKYVRITTAAHPEGIERPTPPVDVGGIAALNSIITHMAPSNTNVAVNITSLLDNISVNEARALYLELKKLFGGN